MRSKLCEFLHSVLFWVLWSVWVLGAVVSLLRLAVIIHEGAPTFPLLVGRLVTCLPPLLIQVGGAVLGLLNRTVRSSDNRGVVSLVVPLCYLGVTLLAPVGRGDGVSVLYGLLGSALVVASFLALGRRFSVARCNWGGLVSEGPYRYVRHPQATGVMLQLLAVGVMTGEVWRATLCVGLVLLHTWQEEGYLKQFREWRDYARYVPPFLPRIRSLEPPVAASNQVGGRG